MALLIVQLSKAYPDEPDLKYYSDKFEWSKRFNAKVASEYFIRIVSPFIREVMTENEEFFIKMDYTDKLNDDKDLNMIKKIIHVWRQSDDMNFKKNIWRYFQLLLTYAIKAHKRQDLAEQLNQYRKTPLKI
jgi:hypothetical protein